MSKKKLRILILIVGVACSLILLSALYIVNSVDNNLKYNALSPAAPINNRVSTLVAVGDIACDKSKISPATECSDKMVADAIKKEKYDKLLLLGDIQYPTGSISELENGFLLNWKELLSKSIVSPGNHDYISDSTAAPLRSVVKKEGGVINDFDTPYSKYKVGNWDVYLLDSNCSKIGGCGTESRQYTWLKQDLEQSSKCSLAMWHHPVNSSAGYAYSKENLSTMTAIFDLLKENNVEFVLNGHEHIYERYSPVLTSKGNLSMRQFSVGTGGINLRKVLSNMPYRENYIDTKYGYLKLGLYDISYDWRFVDAIDGQSYDSGSGRCVK